MPALPIEPEPTPTLRDVACWILLIVLGVVAVGGFSSWLPVDSDTPSPLDAGYRIDVNRDTAATLQLLPGIGPSIASNIVTQRQAHGPFVSPADLEQVRMIGPVLRERITPWIEFGSPPKIIPKFPPELSPESPGN